MPNFCNLEQITKITLLRVIYVSFMNLFQILHEQFIMGNLCCFFWLREIFRHMQ